MRAENTDAATRQPNFAPSSLRPLSTSGFSLSSLFLPTPSPPAHSPRKRIFLLSLPLPLRSLPPCFVGFSLFFSEPYKAVNCAFEHRLLKASDRRRSPSPQLRRREGASSIVSSRKLVSLHPRGHRSRSSARFHNERPSLGTFTFPRHCRA